MHAFNACICVHLCSLFDSMQNAFSNARLHMRELAEEALMEAARSTAPVEGTCCSGCAEGSGCEGIAPPPPPPFRSVADLWSGAAPCGGLPYADDAAAVYTSCAAASPRQRPLVLPTPEEAAADVAAEGAGVGAGAYVYRDG